MKDFISGIIATFIPLFAALNVLGISPMFMVLTQTMTRDERNKLINYALTTSFAVCVLFIVLGKAIFNFLHITQNDFRVAGGLVLLILSIYDILFSNHRRREPDAKISVTPLATPMLAGPATLTTIIILVDDRGYLVTSISLILNLSLVWFIFRNSHLVNKVLGESGARAFAKVAALFLGAIAVMMIRMGITAMVQNHP